METRKFDPEKELTLVEGVMSHALKEVEKHNGGHCAEVFRLGFSMELLAQALKGVRRFYTTLKMTDEEKQLFKTILEGLETSTSALSEVIYLWTAANGKEASKLINEFSNGRKRVTF